MLKTITARKAFCIVAQRWARLRVPLAVLFFGRQCGAVFVRTTEGCVVLPGVRAKLTSSFRTPLNAGLTEPRWPHEL
jgi:hypothetical protein